MKTHSGLGEPSLMGGSVHFSALTLALVFGDTKAALVAKSVLDSLGCRAIVPIRDGPELFGRLSHEVIDIAVVDSQVRSMTGIECVRKLRRLPGTKGCDMPVILLGHGRQPDEAAAARDAGVTEYVRKPFTARALLGSVYAVIEQPRAFVVSVGYAGPDRRRLSSVATQMPANCRRTQTPLIVTTTVEAAQLGGDKPVMVPSDARLKRKMGLAMPQPLNDASTLVERSEHSLESAKSLFAASVHEQVGEILAYNRLLFQRPDKASLTIEAIRMSASLIESRTLDLGYVRVPEVARLLREFCEHHFIAGNDASLFLLEKHALTLMAMLQAGQAGDTGSIGESLLRDLARQVGSHRGDHSTS